MLQKIEHPVMEKDGSGDGPGEASKDINQDDPQNGFPVACHKSVEVIPRV
jgi:hypothetical protein